MIIAVGLFLALIVGTSIYGRRLLEEIAAFESRYLALQEHRNEGYYNDSFRELQHDFRAHARRLDVRFIRWLFKAGNSDG